MLGLYGVVDIKSEQMLTEGSRFWLLLFSQILQFSAYSVAFAIFGIVVLALLRESDWLCALGRAARRWVTRLWTWAERKVPQLGSLAVLLALIVVLTWHWDTWFDVLKSLALVKDSLFAALPITRVSCSALPGVDPTQDGIVVAKLIVQGEVCAPSALAVEFYHLARGYFVLLLLCAIAFSPIERRISQRTALICRITAGAYFTIFTISLPGSFGVLMHEPVYPVVNVSGPGLSALGFRLAQDENGLLIWSDEQRRAQWLPLRLTDQIEAGRPANIFQQRREHGNERR